MKSACFYLGMLILTVNATATTAVYQNTANGAISPDMVIGDTFQITVTGAPNSTVTSDHPAENGDPAGHFVLGTTNANGIWQATGTATSVGEWTVTYSVAGVAAQANEFEVADKPTNITFISVGLATEPSVDLPNCTSNYLGVFGDIKYQIKGARGPVVTGLLMIPYESDKYPDGGSRETDIGPVAGYPTSSKYAADDGSFHDVPFGACAGPTAAPFSNEPMGTQTVFIFIGNNAYQVRANTWVISSTGPGHGRITNNNDVTLSR